MNYLTEQTPSESQGALRLVGGAQRPFGLSELLGLLWRRRTLIFGIVSLFFGLGIVVLFSLTPRFTAQTDLLIDTKESRVVDLQQVLSEATPDKEALLSQIEVIRSRGLIETIVDDYQLTRDPEFNPALRPPSAIDVLGGTIATFLAQILPENMLPAGTESPDLAEPARERNATVDAVLDNLQVGLKGQSRIITVRFTSEDPVKASDLANAIAEAFLLAQLDAKYDATRRANQWLSTKLQDMRDRVRESESAVEEYRRRAGLLKASKDGTILAQQVADLNTQLMAARADRTAAEARLDQVRLLAQSPMGAEAAVDVLGSPIIVDLLRQETEVKRKVAELSDELGERHPRMIGAQRELADVQNKIRMEITKVVQKLDNEASIARIRATSLEKSLTALESRLAQSNIAEVQLRALERDAAANKSTLEGFLSRFEQVSAQTDLSAHDVNARIISRAPVPETPSFPRKWLILGVLLILGLSVAILFVFALESLDRGFRSGDQIEALTGVRSLGLVPVLDRSTLAAGTSPQAYVADQPSSLFGESLRSIYTGILISGNRPTPRSILVTSSQPDEGKSTITACLGRMCAISGIRTLIVEADLRKPSLHRMLEAPPTPGIVEYFLGDAQISDLFFEDMTSGAWFLPAGKLVVDPVRVLASPEIGRLFSIIEDRFDLVLVDSPPLMAVADARILAPIVDTSVFVVRWGKTHRDVVRLGLKTLLETGGHLSGVILSRVDAKRQAEYGFGDSGYYYRNVKSYYTR